MIFTNYILVCLIFGTTFLAIKVGLVASLPPFFSSGIRFLIAGLTLYLFMVLKGRTNYSILFRKEMLLTGVGMSFVTYATLYWAEQYVSSGVAAVLSATGPIILLALQTLVTHQKPSYSSLVGCILALIGIVLLMVSRIVVTKNIWWVFGCLLVLIGESSYAATTLYSKKVIARFQMDSPIALNAVQMIYGGVFLLLLSLFTETVNIASVFTAPAVGSLLYLIVFGSMLAQSLFYWLVAKTNPIFPSTWLYVSPLIAVAIGAIFYREAMNWATTVGVLVTVAGTIIANWDGLKQLRVQRRSRIKSSLVSDE